MAGYTVQVKRPRNEDPLQALIFQGTKRKRADDEGESQSEILDGDNAEFVFRLAQTFDTEQKHVILQRFDGDSSCNKLRVAANKRSKRTDEAKEDQIPEQLQSMIAEYIKPEKKPDIPDIDEIDKETEGYVYDVYYTERAGPLKASNIGYIEVDESERKLIFGDANSDDDSDYVPDDEDDSNAEDYYKNDYPDEDEEDAYNSYGSDTGSVDSTEIDTKLGGMTLDGTWSEDDGDEYERYGWKR